jgi:hypothetical protein
MMKFFKELVKPKSAINPAALIEAQKAFTEIKELQKSNNIDDLKKALFMVSETERKYPFCFDTARYYRGEIVSSLVDKDGFMNSDFNISSPKL